MHKLATTTTIRGEVDGNGSVRNVLLGRGVAGRGAHRIVVPSARERVYTISGIGVCCVCTTRSSLLGTLVYSGRWNCGIRICGCLKQCAHRGKENYNTEKLFL